jgi:hypothetical protein
VSARKLGWDWSCVGRCARPSRGTTKPTRDRCAWCGRSLLVRRGLWGAFEWTGTGRYPVEAALALYASAAAAERFANARFDEGENVVVRFVEERDL